MYFYFSMPINNQILSISNRGDQWYIGSNPIHILGKKGVDVYSLAVGSNKCFVLLTEKGGHFSVPNNVYAFDFKGHCLWNIGEILQKEESLPTKEIFFSSITVHTKETLVRASLPASFKEIALDGNHEYLTAYDGGQEWLFDITSQSYLCRVFTH